MEDIWRLVQNLNIYKCCHIYRKANRTTDCLTKKGICITDSNILRSDFPRDVRKCSFEDYCGTPFRSSLFVIKKKKKTMVKDANKRSK